MEKQIFGQFSTIVSTPKLLLGAIKKCLFIDHVSGIVFDFFSKQSVYLTWSCLAEDFGSCTRASTFAASVVRSPGVAGSNCVMMHWRAALASLLCTTDVSWNMFTTTDNYQV